MNRWAIRLLVLTVVMLATAFAVWETLHWYVRADAANDVSHASDPK